MCLVECGICYNPTVTLSYYNALLKETIYVLRGSRCLRDNYDCVTYFYDQFANVGDVWTGYYDPKNPQNIKWDISVNAGIFATTCLFGSLTVILITMFSIIACNLSKMSKGCCQDLL